MGACPHSLRLGLTEARVPREAAPVHSSGAWKFIWGVSGSLRFSCLGGCRSLGRASRALGRRLGEAATAAEGEEPSPDGLGAEDEHDAVGTALKRVPDTLLGRRGEAQVPELEAGGRAHIRRLEVLRTPEPVLPPLRLVCNPHVQAVWGGKARITPRPPETPSCSWAVGQPHCPSPFSH